MTIAALAVVTVSSVFLFVYGANLAFISARALKLPRTRPGPRLPKGPLPLVAVNPLFKSSFTPLFKLSF